MKDAVTEAWADAFTVTDAWIEMLQAAYGLAKGERRNELAGRYVKSRDDRGLVPYSYIWGAIRALEGLEPVLANEDVTTDPIALRKAAHADADAEFRAEILAGA
jgi:predicted metal-dependent hydrolase